MLRKLGWCCLFEPALKARTAMLLQGGWKTYQAIY